MSIVKRFGPYYNNVIIGRIFKKIVGFFFYWNDTTHPESNKILLKMVDFETFVPKILDPPVFYLLYHHWLDAEEVKDYENKLFPRFHLLTCPPFK